MVNTGIYQCAVVKKTIMIMSSLLSKSYTHANRKSENFIIYKFIHINSTKETESWNFSWLTFLLRKIDWISLIINWNLYMAYNFLSVWKKTWSKRSLQGILFLLCMWFLPPSLSIVRFWLIYLYNHNLFSKAQVSFSEQKLSIVFAVVIVVVVINFSDQNLSVNCFCYCHCCRCH